MNTSRKILNMVIILVIIITVGWRLSSNRKEINQERDRGMDKEIIIPVTTEIVSYKEIEETLLLPGKFEAVNSATVLAEVQGNITSHDIREGNRVRTGETLIEIENPLLLNHLGLAEENLKKALADLHRFKNLESEDAVSKSQMEEVRLAFESANITYKNANEQLKKTKVSTPINGYISHIFVDKGANIGPGTPLFEVSDIDALLIHLSLTEKDIINIFKGMSVEVIPEAYPELKLHGTIVSINVKADMSGRYKTKVAIKNDLGKKILPGMTGTVRIRLDKGRHLVIPRDAITGSLRNAHVYVVRDNICFYKEITVEPLSENLLEVLSGLNENELVVTAGQINLSDSARIKQVIK